MAFLNCGGDSDTLIAHWDFTKQLNPLIDEVNGFEATLQGNPIPAVNSSGVHIESDTQCIYLPKALLMLDTTYEITFGEFNISEKETNTRLFVSRPIDYSGGSPNPTCGLYYSRSNNKWGIYDTTNMWQLSEVSDKDIFKNGKLKIYVDILGKWHIYANDELIFEPVNPLLIQQTIFAIGSSASSCQDSYIEDIKIYREIK